MYGILSSSVNTGSEAELAAVFMAPLAVNSNVPGFALDTVNLKRRASRSLAQRWEIEAAIQPTNNSTAFMVHNVVNSYDTKFFVRMPQLYIQGHGARGLSAKTPVGCPITMKPILTLAEGYTAGSTVLNINGLATYNMMAGEFINFAGDSKVYLVVEPGVNGVGVKIFPSLRKAKSANVEVIYGDRVTMVAYYDTDNVFGVRYSDGVMTDPGTFKLVEAL
jgi:hypothetical protein